MNKRRAQLCGSTAVSCRASPRIRQGPTPGSGPVRASPAGLGSGGPVDQPADAAPRWPGESARGSPRSRPVDPDLWTRPAPRIDRARRSDRRLCIPGFRPRRAAPCRPVGRPDWSVAEAPRAVGPDETPDLALGRDQAFRWAARCLFISNMEHLSLPKTFLSLSSATISRLFCGF